jgi:hypothetical protein
VRDLFRESQDALKSTIQEYISSNRISAGSADLTHLYATSVTIHAASNYRAENLAMVQYDVVDKDGKPIQGADMLTAALRRDMYNIILRSELTYCFWGANLLQQQRNYSGDPLRFKWINPNLWQRMTNYAQGLYEFRIGRSTETRDLTRLPIEDAIYFHGVDFNDDYDGVSPAEVAFLQAGVEVEIASTQLAMFRNMGIPALLVMPDKGERPPNKEERRYLADLFRVVAQGAANFGKTLIAPGRLEVKQLMMDFDKLTMDVLTDKAERAVLKALGVYAELLSPPDGKSLSGAKVYELRRSWLQTWLKPRAHLYAELFTEQVAQRYNAGWFIAPNFSRVEGLEEDIASRTGTVKQQLSDLLIDLGTATKLLGNKPPQAFLDQKFYLVGGVPVPESALNDYWRFQPGMPGQVENNQLHTQAPTTGALPSGATHPTATGAKVEAEAADAAQKSERVVAFIPDAMFREIKNWQLVTGRKGVDYPFEAKSLPPDTAAYGRLLLATGTEPGLAFSMVREDAAKSYDATARNYRAALYDLMISAMTGKASRQEFGDLGRAEISTAFKAAFMEGLRSGGVNDDPDEAEQEFLSVEAKSERSYWTSLANEMYATVVPLREAAQVGDSEARKTFEQARNAMLGRVDQWVNKGVRRMADSGRLYANLNGMKKWVLGKTEKHCNSCIYADGQVHRARTWKKYGVEPRTSGLTCHGDYCDCDLVDTTDPASGNIRAIPYDRSAKSTEFESEAIAAEFAEVAI